MLKRIITILLAVVMLFSMFAVAGCKGQTDDKGKPDMQQTSNEAEEEFFLDMPSELRGTTVKFATWIDHAKTDTAIALAGFEETTGMKYELVQVSERDYPVKMAALISADQSPDVVVENGAFPRSVNLLQPLSLEANGLDPKDPFWDQRTSEFFRLGENYYLVNGAKSSWLMAGTITYYHKTLLEENGLKTPQDYINENNWNLDTFWTLMTQIKSTCNLSGAGAHIDFETWLSVFGGGQVIWNQETDKFENTLESAETKAAIDYLMKAKDEGLAKIIANHDDSIVTGAAAIQVAGCYGLRKSPGWFYTMDVDDLGFAYLPKVKADDADYPFTNSCRAYGICRGAKNARGAAYFLRYFLNEDHYDMDSMFKTDEAKQLYLELREKGDMNRQSLAICVTRVLNPDATANALCQELIDGTAAQVAVNLAKSSSQLDGGVAAANKIIEEFIAAQ